MRFEMGASLAELVKAAGAQALRLEPAIAMTPTITDVGMVALLPGAERSFTIAIGQRLHEDDIFGRIRLKLRNWTFIVLPMRPPGTEGWSEERLAALVTRDAMIGTGLARDPKEVAS